MDKYVDFQIIDAPADNEMVFTLSSEPELREPGSLSAPQAKNYIAVPIDAETTCHLQDYCNPEDYNITANQGVTASTAADDKENDAEIAAEIADDLAARFTFFNDADGLYVFNDITGVNDLLKKTGDYHGTIAYFVTNNVSKDYRIKLKTSIFNLVYSHLRNDRKLSRKMPETNENMVGFKNGAYNIVTGEFVEHSSRFGLKAGIAAYYASQPILSPVSKKFFIHLGGGVEGGKLLFAALGIILSNYRKLGKALILYGPRNNGKSTLAELIRKALPPKLVRGLSMTDFGNYYAIANLKDAHVTICTDLPVGNWSKNAIGKFKQTVTGDFFEAGAKGVQQETIQPRAFIVFIANFLPKIPRSQDPEGAVQRRIWPLKTGKSVSPDKVDPNILEKLLEDIDAITSTAMHEATYFLQSKDLAVLTSAGEEVYEFEPTSIEDCVDEFVHSLTFTGNDTDTIPTQQLYERFVDTYKVKCPGLSTMVINGFAKYLRHAIQDTGGHVKKSNNVSTLFGYKFP